MYKIGCIYKYIDIVKKQKLDEEFDGGLQLKC